MGSHHRRFTMADPLADPRSVTHNAVGPTTAQDSAYVQVGNNTYNYLDGDQSRRKTSILNSLTSEQSYEETKAINPKRVDGTCEWFLSHHKYVQWRDGKASPVLWVSADPGCGKSVLARHLIDEELPKEPRSRRTICYFFFKDGLETSAQRALRSVLHQLLQSREDLFSKRIVARFESTQSLLHSVIELWEVILDIAKDPSAGEIICVFDAYDECRQQDRDEITQALHRFLQMTMTTRVSLKILITSRPEPDIRRGFEDSPVVRLAGDDEDQVGQIAQEICLVIQAKVSEFERRFHLEPQETAILLEGLLSVQNRTYLWVHLTLEMIEQDCRPGKGKYWIRESVRTLPPTLDAVYEKMMSRIEDREEARRLLQIVLAATRPLTVPEIQVALGIRETDRSLADVDLVPDQRFRHHIREASGLLLRIIDNRVFLLHQTAREFLVCNDPAGVPGVWKYSIRPVDSHRLLAELCIKFLLLEEPNISNSTGQCLVKSPLFEYAAGNWHLHSRASAIQGDGRMIELCVLSKHKEPMPWFKTHWGKTNKLKPKNINPLLIAAYCGITPAVRSLFKENASQALCKDGSYGRSALSWAAEHGFSDVVELFLSSMFFRIRMQTSRLMGGSPIESRSRDGRTPLAYACLNGYLEIAMLLLKAGAQTDKEDVYRGTPIFYASVSGNKRVFELVLDRRPESITPSPGMNLGEVDVLCAAITRRQYDITRRILDSRRVDRRLVPTRESFDGLKPLDNSVLPFSIVQSSVTLIHLAAYASSESILGLLLGYFGSRVDFSQVDADQHLTPLHYAALGGNRGTAELLLGLMDVNCPAYTGHTALEVSRDAEMMAWLLHRGGKRRGSEFLGSGDYGVSGLPKEQRQAPLGFWFYISSDERLYRGVNLRQFIVCLAMFQQKTEVLRVFGDTDVDLDASPLGEATIAHLAAYSGLRHYLEYTQLMSPYKDDINTKDGCGNTPLHYAVEGHVEQWSFIHRRFARAYDGLYAKVILNVGFLPLSGPLGMLALRDLTASLEKPLGDCIACIEYHEGLVGCVEVSVVGERTGRWEEDGPLPGHFWEDYEGCIELLAKNDWVLHSRAAQGHTPLHLAVRGSHRVVDLLLEYGADLGARDNAGDTPLHLAMRDGSQYMANYLVEKGADLHAKNEKGQTPLDIRAQWLRRKQGVDVRDVN